MASRERFSCVAAVAVSLILILLCTGVLVWFFTNPFSRDATFSGIDGLRRLIILTKHGKHYPFTKLPGLKLDGIPGSLRPDARKSLEVSGAILNDRYAEFLGTSKVGSLHTVEASLFSESSLALAKGMDLRIEETSNFPDFRQDIEVIPSSVIQLFESLPECLQRQAEYLPSMESWNSGGDAVNKPGAPFLAYLIAADIDAMSRDEILSLRLVCSTEFLLENRPLISPELFMEISMSLSETALDLVQEFRREIMMQLLEEEDPEEHVVSIYGFPEYHLQSLYGCLNFLNMPDGRIPDHVILEIYDRMIRIRIGKAWQNWDLIDLLRSLNNNKRRCESWLLSPS